MMAAGILDAGGRNTTLAFHSGSGYYRRTAIVGLALFVQYWCLPPHLPTHAHTQTQSQLHIFICGVAALRLSVVSEIMLRPQLSP